MRGLPIPLRRMIHSARTEGSGRGREAAAIAAGVFIGCLPVYGLHLILCVAVGTLFRLNRLKTYLAANISNPLVAPWLLLTEVQAGAWIRRGSFHALTVDTVQTTGLRVFAADLLVGSVVVGGALAGLAAWATLALGRGSDGPFADMVRRAADRYAATSITAWEFARGKLRLDPVYRALVCDGWLARRPGAPSRTLVEIGCGQGLVLAMLVEARGDARAGRWPAGWPLPPDFDRLIGVDTRKRVVDLASAALGGDAEVRCADARALSIEPADAVLAVDVLHMMPRDAQEAVLASLVAALRPGGVIVIREADAAAGWRFGVVSLSNRAKAIAFGHWRQRFSFRTAADWAACFTRLGLVAEQRPMGQGTVFANVLFVLTPAAAAIGSTNRTDTSSTDAR
jgi:uncharacterized protein (DUF2062 family)/SAM-dependent methyltransferase